MDMVTRVKTTEGKMLMKCYDRQQRSSSNKLPVFRSILIQRRFVQGNWFPESGTGLSPCQKWETYNTLLIIITLDVFQSHYNKTKRRRR
jgi:hypothetical protein